MTIQDFVSQLIKNSSEYTLTPEDEKILKHEGLQKFIFRKLSSSKYKASAIGADYEAKVLDKITLCLSQKIPIHITLPFGAAKNPYLPTAPGIDWAEVFNIAYLREYLAPIAKAYKYGVILEYISVGVFQEKVNRIPQKDTDLYDKQFAELIAFYQKFQPDNFNLKYSRVEDKIPRERANMLLDKKIAELRENWDKQSEEIKANKLFRAKRNSVFDPRENLEKQALQSALGHDAFCSECWTNEAAPWDQKQMITLGHNYTKGWAIHVRSTPGSSVNFWSGIGIMVEKTGDFIPTVLSPQQYKEIKDQLKTAPIELFDKKLGNLQKILYTKD